MTDLDGGGRYYQQARVYLGPTLGWVMVQVKPERTISAAGTTTLAVGDSIVFVNVNGLVTVRLPKVADWVNEKVLTPGATFEQAIWIKDMGGFAGAQNITVTPNGSDLIDGLASFTIVQAYMLLRLYPLNNLTGWFSG